MQDGDIGAKLSNKNFQQRLYTGIKNMTKILKNNFSYSINSNEPADVLFQDITECSDFLDGDNFKQVVFLVPFCDEPDSVRAESKVYRRHYGPDKFELIDIDLTFPIYHRLRSNDQEATTEAIVELLLSDMNYEPPNAEAQDAAAQSV